MHYPGLQEEAVSSAETQNLIASIAGILQNTTAALPAGPPQLGGPTPAGAGGSPGRVAADAVANAAAAAAAASAMPAGLMLLPHQLGGIPGFPGVNLNDPSLAPFLMGALGAPGLAMDPGLQQLMAGGFPGMPGQPGGMPGLNLASLLAGAGVDLDPSAAADLAAGVMAGAAGKPGGGGQLAGTKRPADGAAGGAYKRERSEEAGRGREQGKCHVDGCNVDLTTAGPYYQRYRTCEAHLKAPCIIKDGLQQRFCQQCGRFHELSEFDNNKRSCRARLHSHNQRRRKRTEEQLANQGGGDGGGGGGHSAAAAAAAAAGLMQGAGALMQPGAAGLGAQMAALGAHGLLGGMGGGAPNLTDILNSMGGVTPELLASMSDPSKMPPMKPDDLTALLSTMSPALLGSLTGMAAASPDAGAALLALAAGGGAAADALSQPLLDIFKGAAGAVPGALAGPADLAGADLQQQLAMALAASAGAAMPDPATMEAALAAAATMDPQTLAAAAAAVNLQQQQMAAAAAGHHHHQHHHHHHLAGLHGLPHDPLGGGGGGGHHLGGHHGDGSI
ncbi:hypothetical protein HYH02_009637 [Chlamydomonas schloesseri]|uniref:SBP-type domain-containing protein n=1 Tax=Chlamydomonas schloesseri TaxID=2026947 RepID=A0A835TB39_9CHLO|nr:hypothetical protein HYH02_009637 [Chlamydomonas schloesseri]|eukprot:KAG2442149.1 hypothetical protein HYH02_009637 [Chlamydomonas schloesseri]